ncbi:MAG: segregation/condensation protein A [Firmicutes bacterium]|nr:segregation/condensation protein A [Bacillota bacterium]
MQDITYRISSFEGPLDLLLSLIQKNKFDIFDIPISEICTQYMDYINEAQFFDPDISSDFLVMASRLMLIKSRMLLPKPEAEGEDDPRAELAAAVYEYAKAKEASEYLSVMYSEHSGRMIKDTDEIAPDRTLKDQDPQRLASALTRLLTLEHEEKESVSRFTPLIKKHSASAEEKAAEIVSYLKENGTVSAEYLLEREGDRSDMIAVFLAILELLRGQEIIIEEDGSSYSDEGVIRTEELKLSLSDEKESDGEDNG